MDLHDIPSKNIFIRMIFVLSDFCNPRITVSTRPFKPQTVDHKTNSENAEVTYFAEFNGFKYAGCTDKIA